MADIGGGAGRARDPRAAVDPKDESLRPNSGSSGKVADIHEKCQRDGVRNVHGRSEAMKDARDQTNRLVVYRNLFGIASLLLAALVVFSVLQSWPVEPSVAMFLSTFGVFLVFSMKLRDTRKTWTKTN